MAAQAHSDTEPALNHTQQQILSYLRETCDTKTYYKSRLIGDELDLSSHEVGLNMSVLAENAPDDINIEKWGYSKATTWKVTTQVN